jgi:hypothetical protein
MDLLGNILAKPRPVGVKYCFKEPLVKNVLVASLFCLTSTIAYAQSNFVNVNKPVICGPVDVILKGLADKEVNEKPVWLGQREDQKTEFYLFLNFDNSAFTIIEAGKEVGCILGIGYKSNFFSPPKTESKAIKLSLPLHD